MCVKDLFQFRDVAAHTISIAFMSARNVFWYSVNVAYDAFSKVVILALASSLAGKNDGSCIKLDMGKNGSQHHQKQDEYHENENCQKQPHDKDRTAPKKG